jgi:voltage-gated potassium channel Kch
MKLFNKKITTLVWKRLTLLIKQPIFWAVTIFGNTFVLIGAILFHFIEKDQQENTITFLDSLNWAVGLVTTIGYGDIMPVTNMGKVLGIVLMIGGTVFLWSYMALLVGAIVAPEMNFFEREIKDIESGIEVIKKETQLDDRRIETLINKIDKLIALYEKK